MRGLQKSYDLKALPLYVQQNEIIEGKRAATAEELKDLDSYFTEAEVVVKEQSRESSKPITGYWGKAIENCEEV